MSMFDEITKKMFMMAITGICVVFALFLLIVDDENGKGMFGDIGKVTNSVMPEDATYKNEFTQMMESLSTEEAPKVAYEKSVLTLGEDVVFRELFSISGEGELYLYDIQSSTGNSQVEWHTEESYASMEELSSAFYYIEDTDTLKVLKPGVYTVLVKAYGTNGKSALYEFLLPVEVD